MKINFITVLNTINYGSALQTFATQLFFEKLNVDVEFVDYWRKDQILKERKKQIIFNKKDTLMKWLKKPVRDTLSILSLNKSYKLFRSFITTNINLTSHKYYNFEDLQKNPPCSDIYATGSDQMWNSSWNNGIEKSFFLEYVPLHKKRIAFSTSIGKTEFSADEVNQIIPLINKYDFITLREQSAVDLLKKYNISSLLVLDPTLLMNKNDWQKFMPKTNITEKYLLVYQLHDTHNNANFDDAVKRISKYKNLKIIRIAYKYSDIKIGKKIVLPKVFEFVSLINNAEFIITDSFHGTAFSINLNKQFVSVYPSEFSTRIDNILKLTNLLDRKYEDNISAECLDKMIDYKSVNSILDDKREKVVNYFKEYLDKAGEKNEL